MTSRDERGFASAQWTVLLVFSFALLFWFANVLLIQYQRAAARSALADAARITARSPGMDEAACRQKVADVLNQIQPGSTNKGIFGVESCTGAGDATVPAVTATIRYDFTKTSILPAELNGSLTGTMSITVEKRQKPVTP